MRISFDENNYVDHVVFNGDTKIEGYDKETPYDFMEKHPECSACFHNSIRRDLLGNVEDSLFNNWEDIFILKH